MTNRQKATDCSVSSSGQAGSSWKDRMGNWQVYAPAAGATLAMSANAQADAVFTGPVNATVPGKNDGTGPVFLGFELLTGVEADDLVGFTLPGEIALPLKVGRTMTPGIPSLRTRKVRSLTPPPSRCWRADLLESWLGASCAPPNPRT